MARIPRLASRTLLGLGTLAGALLTTEIVWRVLVSPTLGPKANPYYVVHDDVLGWRYRPDAWPHTTDAFDVQINLRSHGFRDTEAAGSKRSGQHILALGDELTFGWGVEEYEGFCRLLERQTTARVFNRGVCGYGTDQELLLWRQVGTALKPDLVLLMVREDDEDQVVQATMDGRPKPLFEWTSGELQPVNLPLRESVLARFSHLYRSWKRRSWSGNGSPLTDEARAEARTRIRTLIHMLAEEVREAGAELVVVTFESDWLGPWLRKDGVPHLDLSDALRRAALDGPVTIPDDEHWNAHGHRAVAQALAGFLVEGRWIDGLERAKATWRDLGGETRGMNGYPHLRASGPCIPGSQVRIRVRQLPPGERIQFLASDSSIPRSEYGGTIHAHPADLYLTAFNFTTVSDDLGQYSATLSWPDVPPGTTLFLQCVVDDPSSWYWRKTVSNAVSVTAP